MPIVWIAWSLLMATAPEAWRQESFTIDRWLVTEPFPADTVDPLGHEYLGAPGEQGVIPQRGEETGGVLWRLVRDDSAATIGVDDLFPDRHPEAVVYAHAYLRSPEDRTVILAWGGPDCTRVRAWLNGRPMEGGSAAPPGPEGRSATVRLGRGWNTVLLKAHGAACPLAYFARVSAGPGAVMGLRAQASRPPGEVRTGPDPWVIMGPDGGPAAELSWKGETLEGTVLVRLSAWAVTPVDEVRLKARAGGAETSGARSWLTPGETSTVRLRFPFERLTAAIVGREGVQLELRWGDVRRRERLELDPAKLLHALHAPIVLAGWQGLGAQAEGQDSPDDASATGPPLPEVAGAELSGEWKVPGALSGFSLVLEVGGAPGAYRIASREARPTNERIPLCGPCDRGLSLRMSVRSAGAWTAPPRVLVVDPGYPQSEGVEGMLPPEEWLRALDGKGNKKYRELGARFSRRGPAEETAGGSSGAVP